MGVFKDMTTGGDRYCRINAIVILADKNKYVYNNGKMLINEKEFDPKTASSANQASQQDVK
ncbi:hypothetical protein ACFVAD_01145 [Sutcliffiella sp. NPDC057660]|uniref:hypothetical protein n=1 Tax=Sutcliffiella sp. NPDC057660 TaxID=3346199 RepID=UPI003685A90B